MQSNTPNYDWLLQRGITPEVLALFNIDTNYDHPDIGPCIKVPITPSFSKYRRNPLDDRKPKYLYDTGGKVTLYGFDKLRGKGDGQYHVQTNGYNSKILDNHTTVVITEGELDTLVLWSHNIPAVSSTGGAMSFQAEWATLLAPYQVYLCFDNDDAGAEGMVKVLNYIPDAKIIFIPETPGVKDISDYVARGGDFHALMATARSFPTVTAVEEDRSHRLATWQSVRFHDKYLEKHRQQLYRSTHTYTPDPNEQDEVLRAKQVPITSLLKFTKRKAPCIWHNESTPSLHYYPKTNSVYCFGCGKHGDAIDVYRNIHNASFPETISGLNKML